jgi:hypothetical protein
MRMLDRIAIWPGAGEAERLVIVQCLRALRAAGRTSAVDGRPRRPA